MSAGDRYRYRTHSARLLWFLHTLDRRIGFGRRPERGRNKRFTTKREPRPTCGSEPCPIRRGEPRPTGGGEPSLVNRRKPCLEPNTHHVSRCYHHHLFVLASLMASVVLTDARVIRTRLRSRMRVPEPTGLGGVLRGARARHLLMGAQINPAWRRRLDATKSATSEPPHNGLIASTLPASRASGRRKLSPDICTSEGANCHGIEDATAVILRSLQCKS